MTYAVFIYDKYSQQGVGYKVCPMDKATYDREVAAIIELRDRYNKLDACYSSLVTSKEAAMQIARECLGNKVFESI